MIQYSIDYVAIENYSVHVSKSKGILGRPRPKERKSVDYADMDGRYVDLSTVRYEAREIELECFMSVEDNTTMMERFNTFIEAINGNGLHRLTVEVAGNTLKPLIFEVYNAEEVVAEPEWDATKSVYTFTLKLIEPMPVKRVIFVRPTTATTENNVTLVLGGTGNFDVHWGDGETTWNVGAGTYLHEYVDEYRDSAYIVISGDIKGLQLSSVDCDSNVVWTKI